MRHHLAGLLAVACLAVPATARAAQPQFWQLEGARDFLDGETEGLSVDSEGRVRLAPATRVLEDPEAPYVWSLARDGEGRLYVGTGNDGKVFRVEGGKASLLFDAPELEVHALAVGKDGRLYAGTSPDGKVYAIDRSGKSEVYFDPTDKYIWALAFDDQGRLLVATGAEGRIHRVTGKDKSEVVFTSPEGHITALAVDGGGNLYAGSTPGGVLYRIDRAGKVFVLHDSAYREVKAIDVAPDGSVYAALIDGKDKEDSRPSVPLLPSTTAPPPIGEVTVTESFSLAGPPPPAASPSPRPIEPIRSGASKGAVVRISPTAEVDALWTSSDEMPHALAATEDGVLVGTGNKGKVYRLRADRSWTMIASFPAEQVTNLVRAKSGEVFLGTSNPGKVHVLEAAAGARGTFTSKPRDTDTVSSWGRVRWDAELPAGTEIQVQTRSGNTATPDSTWSAWSAPYTNRQGTAIASEPARFLQMRTVLVGREGRSPVLDTLVAAYLQRNLRPQIQSITVHPPGEVFQKPISLSGEVDILGLDEPRSPEGRPSAAVGRSGMPSATAYSRRLYQKGVQTFSWKADDPNGDTLVYDVHYRPLGDSRFRLLKKGLTDAVLAWDTTTVPNGRYVIKVTGSDAPSNPEGVSLSAEKESAPFDVDNTPPVVTVTAAQRSPVRVKVTVKDDSSIVRKTEYSVDGGKWLEVHPADGINDSLEESYEFVLEELTGPGPHVVVVRASDLLGNMSTGRVEIP
jgi:outer membrane protein assembly factor BamB